MKKPKRWKGVARPAKIPSGGYPTRIVDPNYALLFAEVITGFEHLQMFFVRMLMPLLRTDQPAVANAVLHYFKSASARRQFMEHLLKSVPENVALDGSFDELLAEFEAIATIRNRYAHGLWSTHEDSGQVYLKPSDEFGLTHLKSEPVPIEELASVVTRIRFLTLRLMAFPYVGADGVVPDPPPDAEQSCQS